MTEPQLRREDMLGALLVEGLEPPAGATDPVSQGRAVQLDALPGEDLALPVKRKMIAVFGDQDVGEQGRRREALGDRPLRRGRLMDGPAGSAAVARPADADDPQPCRHVIEQSYRKISRGRQLATQPRIRKLS